MEGTDRFLVGGALGAALAHLLSEKGGETAQPSEPPESAPTVVAVEPPEVAQSHEEAAPLWSPPDVPDVQIPPAPPSDWRPDEPEAESYVPAFGYRVAAETPAEPQVIIDRELLDQPLPGAGWRSTAPSVLEDVTLEEVDDTSLAQTMETPFIEPIADVVVPNAAYADAVESAPDLMSIVPITETQTVEDASRVDDLKSRIEETRRRIRQELESPFDASFGVAPMAHDWTTSPAVPPAVEASAPFPTDLPEIEETTAVRPAEQAPLVTQQPSFGAVTQAAPVMAAEPPGQFASVASVPVEMVEMVDMVELPIEPYFIEPLPVESQGAPVAALPEPIRYEPPAAALPEPIRYEPPAAALPEPIRYEPPVEMVAEPLPVVEGPAFEPYQVAPIAQTTAMPGLLMAEPMPGLLTEPVGPRPLTAEPSPTPSGASDYRPLFTPLESVVSATAVEATVTREPGSLSAPLSGDEGSIRRSPDYLPRGTGLFDEAPLNPAPAIALDGPVTDADLDLSEPLDLDDTVDYDSMRDRIESTRSRLKAKAFDAMMTGEAALLGRDAEGSLPGQPDLRGVDSEVDQTIETSLRELED